ncbi:Beta-ketoacyl synthase, C-terminal domain [Clostridium sp. DSM 8431]|uniref:beta-ketoacyl [acyl carrier protein] synthase domain-containing protein n=1 Tax=Clostridium sp. DSM 8431 TaxID=1761781 RepID=UPI0008E1D4A0|nr:polyketide synthase [Clostridium sp. DSM 8431]SFU88012.1 Beta-ketoacyl synthase, C-terminal domain [Clostridium sp. DSM 8431]
MVFNIADMESFKIGVESEDGLTRCFDKNSTGTTNSEGFITLVLKPLAKAKEDGNYIYGVVKGSAINQNGTSSGITVPSGRAQEEVIEKALNRSKVKIDNIKYIEAHGTGTKIGDNIEIEALANVLSRYTNKKGVCAVGSIKSNYGHLCEGSGILGLVKALAVMRYNTILPNINFIKPNVDCNFINSPLYVPMRSEKIKDEYYCCGLSSFGLSGSNCHVIIENIIINMKIY